MTQQNIVIPAITPIDALQTQNQASTVYENMIVLPGVAVDTFITISDYECNRPVKERALNQAKNKDKISTHLSPTVAIVLIHPERKMSLTSIC